MVQCGAQWSKLIIRELQNHLDGAQLLSGYQNTIDISFPNNYRVRIIIHSNHETCELIDVEDCFTEAPSRVHLTVTEKSLLWHYVIIAMPHNSVGKNQIEHSLMIDLIVEPSIWWDDSTGDILSRLNVPACVIKEVLCDNMLVDESMNFISLDSGCKIWLNSLQELLNTFPNGAVLQLNHLFLDEGKSLKTSRDVMIALKCDMHIAKYLANPYLYATFIDEILLLDKTTDKWTYCSVPPNNVEEDFSSSQASDETQSDEDKEEIDNGMLQKWSDHDYPQDLITAEYALRLPQDIFQCCPETLSFPFSLYFKSPAAMDYRDYIRWRLFIVEGKLIGGCTHVGSEPDQIFTDIRFYKTIVTALKHYSKKLFVKMQEKVDGVRLIRLVCDVQMLYSKPEEIRLDNILPWGWALPILFTYDELRSMIRGGTEAELRKDRVDWTMSDEDSPQQTLRRLAVRANALAALPESPRMRSAPAVAVDLDEIFNKLAEYEEHKGSENEQTPIKLDKGADKPELPRLDSMNTLLPPKSVWERMVDLADTLTGQPIEGIVENPTSPPDRLPAGVPRLNLKAIGLKNTDTPRTPQPTLNSTVKSPRLQGASVLNVLDNFVTQLRLRNEQERQAIQMQRRQSGTLVISSPKSSQTTRTDNRRCVGSPRDSSFRDHQVTTSRQEHDRPSSCSTLFEQVSVNRHERASEEARKLIWRRLNRMYYENRRAVWAANRVA